MDSFVTPRFLNQTFNASLKEDVLADLSNNSTLQHVVLNGSVVLEDDITHKHDASERFALFLMCVLGIPGNVLVIAVYVCKMTSSVRVYMFALAVADLTVCVSGLALATIMLGSVGYNVIANTSRVSVIFSLLLLAFVSTERLLAMRRPHTFSLSIRRAKWALVVIAALTVVSLTAFELARAMRYVVLSKVLRVIVTLASVAVLIVCYTLLAVTMLMHRRTARRNVGVVATSPVPGTSAGSTVNKKGTAITDVTSTTKGTAITDVTSSKHKSGVTTTKAKEAKNVSLLFIITIVLLACWMPYWLYKAGMYVPSYLKRFFFLIPSSTPLSTARWAECFVTMSDSSTDRYDPDWRHVFNRTISELETTLVR